MRKNLLLLSPFVLSLTILSCKSSSSFEKDVRKMAKLVCERERLNKRVMEGDSTAWAKLGQVEKEGELFVKEMEKKHKALENDKKMNEKAEKIMQEEMAKCK